MHLTAENETKLGLMFRDGFHQISKEESSVLESLGPQARSYAERYYPKKDCFTYKLQRQFGDPGDFYYPSFTWVYQSFWWFNEFMEEGFLVFLCTASSNHYIALHTCPETTKCGVYVLGSGHDFSRDPPSTIAKKLCCDVNYIISDIPGNGSFWDKEVARLI